MAIYSFGISVAVLFIVSTLSCLFTEHFIHCIKEKKVISPFKSPLTDYSAIITGLLLGLTLPPGFPFWMAAVGGVVAIALGKWIFGGLGYNLFNPALVGRAFLQAAFPVAITTWTPGGLANRFSLFISTSVTPPFLKPVVDSVTGATPLALMKFEQKTTEIFNLFIGTTSGSAGETSSVIILICGLYLAFRKMLDWRIPISIILSVGLFSGIFYLYDMSKYPSPAFMIFSGGLMLGAVFMATDMVTSPVTSKGVWIYGIFIGIMVVIIRLFGGLPEGVMYAILLGNSITPILNRLTQARPYGVSKKRKSA
jgi:electron transport complex protein RnfD